MSENIIYCYSGSGNCLDMAKNIAKALGDTDIVMMRSFPTKTDATEAKRVGFLFPCYGGGLPGGVESYVKSIRIGIDAYKFAIIQYAGYCACQYALGCDRKHHRKLYRISPRRGRSAALCFGRTDERGDMRCSGWRTHKKAAKNQTHREQKGRTL